MTHSEFNELLWRFYDEHGRHDLPWRIAEPNGNFDPYKIVVSELMLQQTQVGRVIPKFNEFLMIFPTMQALAQAELGDVIKAWSGLGYNRRAKFLWQTAAAIAAQAGVFPETLEELVKLPGIGINTAGAILAYAFNKPALFVETNVRTVYIHHFFNDHTEVADTLILEALQATLDREQPREFYWALMDYGTYLKQTVGNVTRLSTTYSKQSSFEGSKRQIRGKVLKLLAASPHTIAELNTVIADDRLPTVLQDLLSEQLISLTAGRYSL